MYRLGWAAAGRAAAGGAPCRRSSVVMESLVLTLGIVVFHMCCDFVFVCVCCLFKSHIFYSILSVYYIYIYIYTLYLCCCLTLTWVEGQPAACAWIHRLPDGVGTNGVVA